MSKAGGVPSDRDGSGVRLAELIAAMSLATDLGIGQPMEHVLRQSLLAVRLAERLGVDESERAVVYYVALLAWLGCHADSHELAQWFGDDIAFRAGSYELDFVGLPATAHLLRRAGAGSPALTRARKAGSLLLTGSKRFTTWVTEHCLVASLFAERLGLGSEVGRPLHQVFERWDGKGAPLGLSGDETALPARLVQFTDVVEVFARAGGAAAAVGVAHERRGTQFDPELVDLFCRDADELVASLDQAPGWDQVIDAEPALRPALTDEELDAALEAVADFADLKSPYTTGHSRAVADLAAEAGRRFGLPETDVVALRRAALVHDLGQLGLSNAILDKPGELSEAELERVRLHPYLTERMLARPKALARIGAVAALHHERLDGSGYPRGVSAAMLPLVARILAAADVYHAMTEPRPHRTALDPDEAARALRDEVKAGRLDGQAVDAVLAAAGHRVRRRREWAGGLTPREVEVLRLVARGMPNREAAGRLHISAKTVANHVEHIYTKIGASTRAEASLFAMQHGLLDDLEPAEK